MKLPDRDDGVSSANVFDDKTDHERKEDADNEQSLLTREAKHGKFRF